MSRVDPTGLQSAPTITGFDPAGMAYGMVQQSLADAASGEGIYSSTFAEQVVEQAKKNFALGAAILAIFSPGLMKDIVRVETPQESDTPPQVNPESTPFPASQPRYGSQEEYLADTTVYGPT
jgi:hypothetical protein